MHFEELNPEISPGKMALKNLFFGSPNAAGIFWNLYRISTLTFESASSIMCMSCANASHLKNLVLVMGPYSQKQTCRGWFRLMGSV